MTSNAPIQLNVIPYMTCIHVSVRQSHFAIPPSSGNFLVMLLTAAFVIHTFSLEPRIGHGL